MSIKLKALGLGLLALVAMSAVAAMNASATTGGHFTSQEAHTILKGEDEDSSDIKLLDHTLENTVTCQNAKYEGTTNATTVESVTLSATYEECSATLDSKVPVTMNGCAYIFTIGNSSGEDNTTHLECPPKAKVEIHIDPAFVGTCTVTIAPQTPDAGVAYTTDETHGIHAITADVTATGIDIEYHSTGSGCGFDHLETGTFTNIGKPQATLIGNARITGFNTEGAQRAVTATGSSGS